jgi:hypothetical protein
MSPSQAWLVYILVVIVAFLLLSIIAYTNKFNTITRLFLSFLIGALLIFILSPSIITKNEGDRTWYGLLVLVAFVVPLILGIWMIFAFRSGTGNFGQRGECVVERTIQCDETGACHVAGENRHCPAVSDQPDVNIFDSVTPAAPLNQRPPSAGGSPRRRVSRRRSTRGQDDM